MPRRPSGSFRIVGLALAVGVAVGGLVVVVKALVALVQEGALGFSVEHRAPAVGSLVPWRVAAALCGGAVLISVVSALAERLDRKRGREAPIDVIEANALRGGLLRLWDGVSVVGPILTSVSCGASVGIEAAVTQIGAVLASLLGQRRRLPRSEMRLLVGAGAAAAIGAAYGAPIAGTLYAFELVLGEYSPRMLAPVGLAALVGSVLASAVLGDVMAFEIPGLGPPVWSDYPLAVAIGGLCAAIGIATMLLVSSAERLFRRVLSRSDLRLVAGALLMAGLASVSPGVLGSGHAGISDTVNGKIFGLAALTLLGAKMLASAISLGAGFRGGLFSASLLIGALVGQVVAAAALLAPGVPHAAPALCTAIAMAAMGASIIGSPLAMIFLVLETGGGVQATVVIAVGAVVSSFLTSRLFGYSFATWRFQQRGLALDDGQDIARLSAVPIKGLIRPPKRAVQADADLDAVLRAVSAAASRGTAVYALDGAFLGLIDPSLVEILEDDQALPVIAADLLFATTPSVTAHATLAELLDIFKTDDRATLAIVDPKDSHRLVGCVRARDAFALASLHLDAQRRDDLGST